MTTQIQLRRDTAANWASGNPTLAAGELGVDLTASKIKLGNGSTAWTSLPSLATDYGYAVIDPALGNGSTDCTAAFQAAVTTGKPIFVPPGVYQCNSDVITDLDSYDNLLAVYGCGSMHSTIQMSAGKYFVNTPDAGLQLHFQGLQFYGGAGAFRETFTGVTSNGLGKTFTDCVFRNYTGCAVSAFTSDSPFWKFTRCHWIAANETSTMGIAVSGFIDSMDLIGCEFWSNRVHVKIDNPNNLHVFGGWGARLGTTSPGNARVSFWFVPGTNPNGPNGGGGLIDGFKFGNENLLSSDFFIVVAEQGSGTDYGSKFPDLTNASANYSNSWAVTNCLQQQTSTSVPLVRSMTPNLWGTRLGPIHQAGNPSPYIVPLLSLKTATGFDPHWNMVGPAMFLADPYHPPAALVVADAGTLVAQPPMLGQEQNARNVGASATTYTVRADSRISTFTGSAATWTLPPAAADTATYSDNTGVELWIKNKGSGTLTVQRAGTDSIYAASAVTSVTVAAGASLHLMSDGTHWVVL